MSQNGPLYTTGINKKINREKEAKKVYVNNFLAYIQELENRKLHDGSRSQRIKNFTNSAEYIIFGPLLSPERKSKKLDIATGGYDEDEAIPELKLEESPKKEHD